MSDKTTVKLMQIEEKRRIAQHEEKSTAQWIDFSGKKRGDYFQPDRLLKNLAVSCGLMLVILAVRTAAQPDSQSVFGALETGMNMKWDESVGKLSFVNALMPEEIRQVWNETEPAAVLAPVQGDVVHAWSESEPYMEISTDLRDVRAVADGEIMSIAHGMEEERIVRVRHLDGTEALYGNLQECYHDVGDPVFAGDPFALLMDGKPLAFEYRRDGRSVELKNGFQTAEPLP